LDGAILDAQLDKTILLVDDEDGIRTVLGISLADIGYEVITAEHGGVGFERFRQHNPPIVITDIKMPVMDGIDLLKRIKRENTETEVIMLTGHGDMELAIKCLKLEATDFITKPINDDALEIALKRAHERILMRRQLRDYTENLERLVEEKSARLVAAERRAAVGQALEGVAAAMQNIASDLDGGIHYLNDLPCFVSIHSPQLEVVAANQRYEEKLGNRVGQPSCEIYKAADRSAEPCPVKTTFDTGKGQRCQAMVTFADDTETPVIVYTAPIRNGSGQVELVVEIAADIAEIRRLQEALRTTEQRYEQLFNAAPCYITVQDRNLQITAANKRFREDFRSDAGLYCYAAYQHREHSCDNCPVLRTFSDGQPHQCEMDAHLPNGEQRRMLIWTSPLRDSSGGITHVMEMSTDVTQMRRLQDQLASLGLMIGSVSHGIKGLLTGLDGGMYALDSGFAKDDLDRIKEGWGTVRLMIERIRALVLDILFYAKEKDLKWERVDVIDFAQDIANLMQAKIDRHAIDLQCEFDPGLKEFDVDAGFMRATLTNILENAIEACVNDTDTGKKKRIEFKVHSQKNRIVFEICDNGVGMDAETRSKIFTPFYISKKKQGSGLGLFIASQILEKNHGRILVSSQPGAGTCFTIRLPKHSDAAAAKGTMHRPSAQIPRSEIL
jgi:signal transduction histidine kinase/FixJ family two-component response regulator